MSKDIRFDFKLPSNAVVWDVGAYKGEWAQWVRDTYGCPVWLFEPVYNNWRQLLLNFHHDPLYFIYDFALLDENKTTKITLKENSSSLYGDCGKTETIKVRDVWQFIQSFKLHEGRGVIDLMKLNCEGSEYPILRRLLDVGWLDNVNQLVIQFHGVPEFEDERKVLEGYLRSRWQVGHDCDYWTHFFKE